jgi:hypothetical protein
MVFAKRQNRIVTSYYKGTVGEPERCERYRERYSSAGTEIRNFRREVNGQYVSTFQRSQKGTNCICGAIDVHEPIDWRDFHKVGTANTLKRTASNGNFDHPVWVD